MTDNEEPLLVDAHGGWKGLIGSASDGTDLSAEAAEAAMADMLGGRATPVQIAGLIVALRSKGESVPEMIGMVRAMLAASEPLSAPADAIDIVGTGGSNHRRSHALNVSTMACFVAAAAGATVCKHGNYRASSTSGAFDFLATLGVDVEVTPAQLEATLVEHRLGFALARTFHPAMRYAGPVRAELGIPTVFNLLGPLANPGRVVRQVVGTATTERAEQLAGVLHGLGSQHAWVVSGADGLDELSTHGPSVVFVVTPEGVERRIIDATSVGLEPPASLDALAGGDAAANLEIFRSMMSGTLDARSDIVILNAGAGLVVANVASDLADGVDRARSALRDGSVASLVERYVG